MAAVDPSGKGYQVKTRLPLLASPEQNNAGRATIVIDLDSSDGKDHENLGHSGYPNLSTTVESRVFDVAIAHVVDVVPDVNPEFVIELCRKFHETYHDKVHEAVLNFLFESPDYPKKQSPSQKRKRDSHSQERDGKAKEPKIDYESAQRPTSGGPDYLQLTWAQLTEDFPLVPIPHIRSILRACNGHYAPTYLRLQAQSREKPLPYTIKVVPTRAKGKSHLLYDAEYEEEKAWLADKQNAEQQSADTELAARLEEEELEASGMGVECGCCFAEYAFDKMVQCPEAHLFCKDCAQRTAEETIGNQKTDLLCMDQSGCKQRFHMSEVTRFLPEKMVLLWEKIKTTKALESAGLEGLESCPFCSYSVVIENDQEKLFRCDSADCGAVSCRSCKKPDHLPRSCKEVEDDRKLGARHVIEEAMTSALTRKCPKCNNPFIKSDGCNKMTCPSCRTLSCYLCRNIITGYEHFGSSKCNLWDAIELRGHDEVAKAAYAALEKYKEGHPDADDLDINIRGMLPVPLAQERGAQAPVYANHAQIPAAGYHVEPAAVQGAPLHLRPHPAVPVAGPAHRAPIPPIRIPALAAPRGGRADVVAAVRAHIVAPDFEHVAAAPVAPPAPARHPLPPPPHRNVHNNVRANDRVGVPYARPRRWRR